MTYSLVRQDLGDGLTFLSLSNNGKSIPAQLLLKKEHEKARAITKAAKRIARRGTDWGLTSETLIQIKGTKSSLMICELKIKTTTIRVMAYVHNDERQTPVLLFYFEAHQIQARGGIPSALISRAERLATIAHDLMVEKDKRNTE